MLGVSRCRSWPRSATSLGAQVGAGARPGPARVGVPPGRAFSAQEVSRFGAPTLISRSTNDVTQVQTVMLHGPAMMVSAPIMMVGGVFMALREDVGLSWLVRWRPALGVSVGAGDPPDDPAVQLMQEAVDWVNRVLREQITGIRVVRAFVREDHERERFGDANRSTPPPRSRSDG